MLKWSETTKKSARRLSFPTTFVESGRSTSCWHQGSRLKNDLAKMITRDHGRES